MGQGQTPPAVPGRRVDQRAAHPTYSFASSRLETHQHNGTELHIDENRHAHTYKFRIVVCLSLPLSIWQVRIHTHTQKLSLSHTHTTLTVQEKKPSTTFPFRRYIEGFRPGWYISTMISSRDTPFWLETVDIWDHKTLYMKTQTLATSTTICTGPSQDIILLYLCLMISVSYWGTVTSLNPFALTPAMSANPYLLQTTPSLSCFASVSLSFSVKPTLSCHNKGKHMRGKTICYIFFFFVCFFFCNVSYCLSTVFDQNGLSQLYIMVEINHSRQKPLICILELSFLQQAFSFPFTVNHLSQLFYKQLCATVYSSVLCILLYYAL